MLPSRYVVRIDFIWGNSDGYIIHLLALAPFFNWKKSFFSSNDQTSNVKVILLFKSISCQ